MQFYREGRKQGDFEAGIRTALQALLASPKFVFRVRGRRRRACGRARTIGISDLDLASRLSFFLWQSVPDAELRNAAASGALQEARGAREAGAPDAGRSAVRVAVHAVRVAVAASAGHRQDSPGRAAVSRLRQRPGRIVQARNRTVLRQHRARGPQRPRPADGRLHVRQRADRERLRHPEHHRRAVPARDGHRRERRGTARPGQHPDAHVGRRPHVAGAARQVDHGSAARVAAAAAAAERAGARGHQGGRRMRASCCRRASGWKSTGRTRCATRATV